MRFRPRDGASQNPQFSLTAAQAKWCLPPSRGRIGRRIKRAADGGFRVKKALVLGGGFAGCAAAHQLMLMGGWDVTLVEQAPFLGAGNRTMYYGGHPHTF